jgi:hypothetical protein
VGLHPFSLPRAVNDSLPAQIFGIRMSQTDRLEPGGGRKRRPPTHRDPFLPIVNGNSGEGAFG